MKLAKSPDANMHVNQQNYLYFGGTAYLGLQTNTDFQTLVIQKIKKWGTSYGSSRLANIGLEAYDSCEMFLSKFIKSEAAVTVSSGMLAGKIVLKELEKSTDVFYHFAGNHEAISTSKSLPFYENNKINSRLLDNNPENISILVDGVISGYVLPFDVSILDKISSQKKITLVLDESHSIGILGQNGCGLYDNISHQNIQRKISIASLGKALGVTGGVIASDFEFIESIRSNEIFGSSAGMNPAFAEALSGAENLIANQNQKMKQNLLFLNNYTEKNDFILFDATYPLIYPKIKNIYQHFLEENIIITHFQYPNSSEVLNRIVVTANHRSEDLQKVAAILNQFNQ